MIRRSWIGFAIVNACIAVASFVLAVLFDDPVMRWAMIGNGFACCAFVARALNEDAKERREGATDE